MITFGPMATNTIQSTDMLREVKMAKVKIKEFHTRMTLTCATMALMSPQSITAARTLLFISSGSMSTYTQRKSMQVIIIINRVAIITAVNKCKKM